MMRYVCCPLFSIPKKRPSGVKYISLYESGLKTHGVGDVALFLKQEVYRAGIQPSIAAWDFCSIAMAIAAIDETEPRDQTADGWTRVLEAEIHLAEPLFWQNQVKSLEQTLRFLTGDFWKLRLVDGGVECPHPRRKSSQKASCVSLLSGGMDSLVGAIDLCNEGEEPFFVSKTVAGNSNFQREVVTQLKSENRHVQWSFNSRSPWAREGSTRARSIIFFAYAALVASHFSETQTISGKMPLFVPENGFISLNLPLTSLRLGTLSTKTTHPIYLSGIQEIWNAVGLHAELKSPFEYCYKTKGEMLSECRNLKLLKQLIGSSASCGRYGRFNKKHCGRCIPCLVRRGSFLQAGIKDTTTRSTYQAKNGQYVYTNLRASSKDKSAKDIRAAAMACLKVEREGIDSFISHGLAFALPNQRLHLRGVVERGLGEIRYLLESHKVL